MLYELMGAELDSCLILGKQDTDDPSKCLLTQNHPDFWNTGHFDVYFGHFGLFCISNIQTKRLQIQREKISKVVMEERISKLENSVWNRIYILN